MDKNDHAMIQRYLAVLTADRLSRGYIQVNGPHSAELEAPPISAITCKRNPRSTTAPDISGSKRWVK